MSAEVSCSVGDGVGGESYPDPNDESGETMKEKMLRKVYALATGPRPERWAVEFIADRTEGKALERIDQTTRLEPFKLIER